MNIIEIRNELRTHVDGLGVDVLRNARANMDCTNGGDSSQVDEFTIVGIIKGVKGNNLGTPGIEYNAIPAPQGVSEKAPAIVIIERDFYGEMRPCAVPLEKLGAWTMFGGNFITCSDSRFPGRYPIPVHDRIETA